MAPALRADFLVSSCLRFFVFPAQAGLITIAA
jgi:hypothetical protein